MSEAVLDPIDRAIVARLARIAGEHDAARRELAAHAVSAVRESHVCLSPALYARRTGLDESGARDALRALSGSGLVVRRGFADACGDDGTPFVLDPHDRLYLARYFDHQRELAARLVAIATARSTSVATPDPALVDSLFPRRVDGRPDLQRDAALAATQRSFTIVSGGPGTGKTSTVVKLLALLVDGALRAGRAVPRVVLLAPTGKAAARLGESIRASRDRLAIDERIRVSIPDVATTVHRALRVRPDGGFVRGVSNPLEADVVLVDEASMIDLALMRSLVDAVRPGATLVLLGDRDQLASVEAGSVLADLCDASTRPGSPLEGALSELTESHRFSADSGIGALARAIREGDADAAFAVLDDARYADVTLDDPIPSRGRLPLALQRAARRGFSGLLLGTPAERVDALTRYRVLTAHRVGPLGVAELGVRIARAIGREAGTHAQGTPILVLENDTDAGLSNGDVGVVGEVVGDDSAATTTYFATADAPRAVATGRLPRHEACWAMSIHKSQGSEFDVVSIVVPDGSAVTSRELLYTAITRARSTVVVHASRATIEDCIGRRIVRASGLVDAVCALATR